MHLVGFIIRIYQDARSSECQIYQDTRSSECQILPETKALIMPIWPDSCKKTEWISSVPEILENHSFLNMNN